MRAWYLLVTYSDLAVVAAAASINPPITGKPGDREWLKPTVLIDSSSDSVVHVTIAEGIRLDLIIVGRPIDPAKRLCTKVPYGMIILRTAKIRRCDTVWCD